MKIIKNGRREKVCCSKIKSIVLKIVVLFVFKFLCKFHSQPYFLFFIFVLFGKKKIRDRTKFRRKKLKKVTRAEQTIHIFIYIYNEYDDIKYINKWMCTQTSHATEKE